MFPSVQTGIMTPLQVFHIGITLLPWIIGIFVRNPLILLIALAAQVLVMTQWIVLGHCILSPIENNGSKNSITVEQIAAWLKLPVEEFNKGFTLINATAPSFLQFSRIAKALTAA